MKVLNSEDLARQASGLRAFTTALCAQDSDAADASQSALLAALEQPERQRSSLAGWLRGTSRFLEIRRHRQSSARLGRETSAARSERVPSAAELAERLEIQRQVLELVSALPPKQAEALYLRFWEDRPPAAIAAALQIPLENVKSRLRRGLIELRQQMDAQTEGGRERWLGALGVGAAMTPTQAGTFGLFGLASVKWIVAALAAAALIGWGIQQASQDAPATHGTDGLVALDSAEDGEVPRAELTMAGAEAGDAKRVALGLEQASVLTETSVVPRVINGTVLDIASSGAGASERPAAGVTVSLSRGWVDMHPLTATTDANGHFEIVLDEAHAAEESLNLRASGDSRFRPASTTVPLKDGKGTPQPIVLPRYLFGTLIGTLVCTDRDDDGRFQPLEGVVVRAGEERGATTDESGLFTFYGLPSDTELSLDSADWISVVNSDKTRPSDEGVWPEVRLLAVRPTSMEVTVLRHDGSPLEGASVNVRRAECEAGRLPGGRWEFEPDVETTGPDGIALLPRVWSQQRLRVGVRYGEEHELIERYEGPLGEFLVGRPGETLRCTVRMDELRRVSGRVFDEDGEPAHGVGVWLRSFNRGISSGGSVSRTAVVDEQGHFEIVYQAGAGPLGNGQLGASTEDSISGWMMRPDASRLAHTVVSLDRDVTGVELRIAPTFSISGIVKGPDGAGVQAKVKVLSPRKPSLRSQLPTGLPSVRKANKEGRFTFKGVPPGQYNLEIQHRGFEPVMLTDVEAGSSDLEIELAAGLLSTLKIEVVPPRGRTISKFGLSEMRLSENDAEVEDFPRLDRVEEIRAPRAMPNFQGAVGAPYRLESGLLVRPWRSSDRAVQGATAELKGQPGPAEIILRFVVDGEGRRLAPTGTGPVILSEGVTTLRFYVRPVGIVEGQLLASEGDGESSSWEPIQEPYFANLQLPDGRYLLLPDARVEVGALGLFRISRAPVGSSEVHVGTAEEWLRGEPRFKGAITVQEGEPTFVLLK